MEALPVGVRREVEDSVGVGGEARAESGEPGPCHGIAPRCDGAQGGGETLYHLGEGWLRTPRLEGKLVGAREDQAPKGVERESTGHFFRTFLMCARFERMFSVAVRVTDRKGDVQRRIEAMSETRCMCCGAVLTEYDERMGPGDGTCAPCAWDDIDHAPAGMSSQLMVGLAQSGQLVPRRARRTSRGVGQPHPGRYGHLAS